MSILTLIPSRPQFAQPEYREVACEICHAVLLVPEDRVREFRACEPCKHAMAEALGHQALCDVRDLVRGRGVFACLTLEERREQLRGYGLGIEPDRNSADAPDAATRDDLESRIELEPIDGERWDGLE